MCGSTISWLACTVLPALLVYTSALGAADLLGPIRLKHNLPALAVAVVKDGKPVEINAVGVRKDGDKTPVSAQDKFHIGSCTKSLTATLAGILIDEGKLRWDSTIVEVLPELKGKIHGDYEAVTLEQLLQNRGGLPTEPPAKAWEQAWRERGTIHAQRREFIAAALNESPAAKPGTKMIYSNQGYTVAGAMLEKVSGKSWEDLAREKLFKPLKMTSAGFGAPGVKGKVDQPWGHSLEGKTLKPLQMDNPPAIAPAGRVHCSLGDLASYARLHLADPKLPQLLKPETLARLHTPPQGEEYAAGWICLERPWAKGPALMHNGSNSMWYCVMWLAPKRNFAVLVATNVAGEEAEAGCDEVAAAMIEKWLKD